MALKPFRFLPRDIREWARWMKEQDIASDTDLDAVDTRVTTLESSLGETTATSDGDTGGTGSAGAGNQYIEITVNGITYKVLHDGTV